MLSSKTADMAMTQWLQAHLQDQLPLAVLLLLKQQQLEAAALSGVHGHQEALVDVLLAHVQLIEVSLCLVYLSGCRRFSEMSLQACHGGLYGTAMQSQQG